MLLVRSPYLPDVNSTMGLWGVIKRRVYVSGKQLAFRNKYCKVTLAVFEAITSEKSSRPNIFSRQLAATRY